MKKSICFSLLLLAASAVFADKPAAVSGDYLEVRSCDVYTGFCFANSEMNLAGKEGMLFWSVREGAWNGVRLDGLSVLAVVAADETLGDVNFQPRTGRAVLIVDSKAGAAQKAALADFAAHQGGKIFNSVVEVRSAVIKASLATCAKGGCASVKAGDQVEITTSCLGTTHDICGNEATFYPPLSKVEGAYPAFTEVARFDGPGLNRTWQIAGKRSAFLASFTVDATAAAATDLAQNVQH